MNTSKKKRLCIVLLVGRSTIVEPVSKERAFPAWCCTKQTKLSRRLLHPPSTVLPICLRTARARPTTILRAVTFHKNVLGFNPHQ